MYTRVPLATDAIDVLMSVRYKNITIAQHVYVNETDSFAPIYCAPEYVIVIKFNDNDYPAPPRTDIRRCNEFNWHFLRPTKKGKSYVNALYKSLKVQFDQLLPFPDILNVHEIWKCIYS